MDRHLAGVPCIVLQRDIVEVALSTKLPRVVTHKQCNEKKDTKQNKRRERLLPSFTQVFQKVGRDFCAAPACDCRTTLRQRWARLTDRAWLLACTAIASPLLNFALHMSTILLKNFVLFEGSLGSFRWRFRRIKSGALHVVYFMKLFKKNIWKMYIFEHAVLALVRNFVWIFCLIREAYYSTHRSPIQNLFTKSRKKFRSSKHIRTWRKCADTNTVEPAVPRKKNQMNYCDVWDKRNHSEKLADLRIS